VQGRPLSTVVSMQCSVILLVQWHSSVQCHSFSAVAYISAVQADQEPLSEPRYSCICTAPFMLYRHSFWHLKLTPGMLFTVQNYLHTSVYDAFIGQVVLLSRSYGWNSFRSLCIYMCLRHIGSFFQQPLLAHEMPSTTFTQRVNLCSTFSARYVSLPGAAQL
jgi:hypothetical protein